MFLRVLKDSFARQPRRKLLTAAALGLAASVATASLSVALDVGDRLAQEFRSLGANLLVTPQADTLPLQIGGVDYRPVEEGAYLHAADLGKLKTIFWRNNIMGFAPFLDVPVTLQSSDNKGSRGQQNAAVHVTLVGTWYQHNVPVPDGEPPFSTGLAATNPSWQVSGRWFSDSARECVVGVVLARRNGIAVGQTIEIHSGDRNLSLLVTGIVSTGGQEDEAVLAPLEVAQQLSGRAGQYRTLLVSALTKPADAFSERDPNSMSPADYDRWYCSPYISSISRQIQEQLPGVEVRAIRPIVEGEGRILTHVSALMWLVTIAALLGAALAVAATAGTTVLERTGEIGLMKALGATRVMVGAFFLGEQWFLAVAGGGLGYAVGLVMARLLGQHVFGVSPEMRWMLLPVVLGVAIVVATAGSLLPLRRVIRLDPAPVLRGE